MVDFVFSIFVAVDAIQHPSTPKKLEISLSWEGNN